MDDETRAFFDDLRTREDAVRAGEESLKAREEAHREALKDKVTLPSLPNHIIDADGNSPFATPHATDDQLKVKIREALLRLKKKGKGKGKSKGGQRELVEWMLDHGQVVYSDVQRPGLLRGSQRKGEVKNIFPIKRIGTRNREAVFALDFDAIRNRGSIFVAAKAIKKLSKTARKRIRRAMGYKCSHCGEPGDDDTLQVDHAVPYDINGDDTHWLLAHASCNRKKGIACKSCPNHTLKVAANCYSEDKRCLWACRPGEEHTHVAMVDERVVLIKLTGAKYERLHARARAKGVDTHAFVGELLDEALPEEALAAQ